VDVLWTAARGTFVLAVLGAVAAMALRSDFFRSPLGRALGALAILVALAPASLRSPGLAAADFMATVLFLGWIAASAALLLRGHGAAWVLFGIFTVGGREVIALLAQPASEDQAAGWLGALLLGLGAAALLIGRRIEERPVAFPPAEALPPPELPEAEPEPPAPPPAPPTSPWSGSA